VADDILSSALSAWAGELPMLEPDHSGGLMVMVGILYASLLAALVLTRCRRVHQSYAFLKYVIETLASFTCLVQATSDGTF
jgi:hypothetical protein